VTLSEFYTRLQDSGVIVTSYVEGCCGSSVRFIEMSISGRIMMKLPRDDLLSSDLVELLRKFGVSRD